MNKKNILKKLHSTKIKTLQLDPFGYCNNACWFCPNKYLSQPQRYQTHMSVGLLDSILKQFYAAKGTVVAESFRHIWTCHYNEILLYRHFEHLLKLLEKYNFCTTILSNGNTLSESNIEKLVRGVKSGVILEFCLNIPSVIPRDYKRYTGQPRKVCREMVKNVKQLLKRLRNETSFDIGTHFYIVVNGIADQYRSILDLNTPILPPGDLERQYRLIAETFPDVACYKQGWLLDRAGLLADLNVFKPANDLVGMRCDTIECIDNHESGGRIFGWAHVNSRGELFLCCMDYNCEYVFGSLEHDTLKDIWYGNHHIEVIQKAWQGICRRCCKAKAI